MMTILIPFAIAGILALIWANPISIEEKNYETLIHDILQR
jgi:hypothetical protein